MLTLCELQFTWPDNALSGLKATPIESESATILELIGSVNTTALSDTAYKRRAQERPRCEEPGVVLSRLAGLVVGLLVITVVEGVSSKVYPLPRGIDPSNPEAFKAYLAQLPLGAFILVFVGWGAGSFLGSWSAVRIAPQRRIAPGVVVGVVLLGAGVANMLMLPHPIWFWGTALVVFALSTYFGTKVGVSHS